MILKVRGDWTIDLDKVIAKLVKHLLDQGPTFHEQANTNFLWYYDLGLDGEKLMHGKYPGLSPDMTSGGTQICQLNEIRRVGQKWHIALNAFESVYQSHLFENSFDGGLPLWKVPRHMIEPVLKIMRQWEVSRWQVTFQTPWALAPSFEKYRAEGNKASWLIPPERIYDLFDEVGAFPIEKGVVVCR
ncbi:MAG: hypothetical protein Q7S28_02015 [bacterium]|nr:hypothetical protein [bacterium]